MQVTIEDKFIGDKLRFRRVFLGISQTKLGQCLNVSFQQIQKYEKGENRIASSSLYKISKLLCVPITYFFDGLEGVLNNKDDFDKQLQEDISLQIVPDLKKLNKYFSNIKNPLSRKTIINITKNLLSDEKQKNNNDIINKNDLLALSSNGLKEDNKKNSVEITKKEQEILIRLIQNNSNFCISDFNNKNKKYIKSLIKKSFIEKDKKTGLFSVEKNSCLLFEIEGSRAFDEIIKNNINKKTN